MASQSLLNRQNRRGTELDEIAQARALVGGTSRGRRTATQQINYAYAALLSSQFQGFCRDLHSECVDHLVAVLPVNFQTFLRAELVRDRKLDKGNPNPGNIGADFNRLGVYFWTDVKALRPANDTRQAALEELNVWRNAIAHQNFALLGDNSSLRLATVRRWRSATDGLAKRFDRVMRVHLKAVLGKRPW